MRMRKKVAPYRDGYVDFVKPLASNVSSFGAPLNTRAQSDTVPVVTLAYDRMSLRQQDLEFAYNMDKNIDLKIRCPYHPDVDSRLQALIGSTLYDVTRLDPDANNMQMFIYLTENRKI